MTMLSKNKFEYTNRYFEITNMLIHLIRKTTIAEHFLRSEIFSIHLTRRGIREKILFSNVSLENRQLLEDKYLIRRYFNISSRQCFANTMFTHLYL